MKKIKKFKDYEEEKPIKKKKRLIPKKQLDDFEGEKWNKNVFLKKHFEEE